MNTAQRFGLEQEKRTGIVAKQPWCVRFQYLLIPQAFLPVYFSHLQTISNQFGIHYHTDHHMGTRPWADREGDRGSGTPPPGKSLVI